MHMQMERMLSGSRKAIRSMMWVNFALFLLFVVPFTNHSINRGLWALRSINLEEPVGRSLQIWVVGSTLVATVLLVRMFWQRRRTISGRGASISLKLETILVAAWWAIVLGSCAYGFMLGMGG
jgi:hypothetical protein